MRLRCLHGDSVLRAASRIPIWQNGLGKFGWCAMRHENAGSTAERNGFHTEQHRHVVHTEEGLAIRACCLAILFAGLRIAEGYVNVVFMPNGTLIAQPPPQLAHRRAFTIHQYADFVYFSHNQDCPEDCRNHHSNIK